MRLSNKSDSDVTSLGSSSSPLRSPKCQVYYVQAPSSDKSSSMQGTPVSHSPMDSPSHRSLGNYSRDTSESRVDSGLFQSSSSCGKGNRKRNLDKRWAHCDVILEEAAGSYQFEENRLIKRLRVLIAFFSFVLLFTLLCFILWGVSRPYKAEITVKSLTLDNFYVGEGSDFSGVVTKMVTLNGSLWMSIYNPAPFFGIHVSSNLVNLAYSEITIATGQMKKYYQPRKSHRTVLVNLIGNKIPMYGAGSSMKFSGPTGGEVPLFLQLQIRSRGDVVGKLVQTRHKKRITCPVVMNSTTTTTTTKPITFIKNNCTYE